MGYRPRIANPVLHQKGQACLWVSPTDTESPSDRCVAAALHACADLLPLLHRDIDSPGPCRLVSLTGQLYTSTWKTWQHVHHCGVAIHARLGSSVLTLPRSLTDPVSSGEPPISPSVHRRFQDAYHRCTHCTVVAHHVGSVKKTKAVCEHTHRRSIMLTDIVAHTPCLLQHGGHGANLNQAHGIVPCQHLYPHGKPVSRCDHPRNMVSTAFQTAAMVMEWCNHPTKTVRSHCFYDGAGSVPTARHPFRLVIQPKCNDM